MNELREFITHSDWFWPVFVATWYVASFAVGCFFGRLVDAGQLHERDE
jgi:hypothetical protein